MSGVRVGFRRWLPLLVLLMLGPAPGSAAPAVAPERRTPRVAAYDSAARELGFSEWGVGEKNHEAVHVFARLDADRATLLVALPPMVARPQGEQWLQRLADRMGWRNVDLYSDLRPGGLFLRAEVREGVRSLRFGRRQAQLDAETLRAAVAELTSLPVLLAVRAPGAEEAFPSVEAAQSGKSGGDLYLFYRLDPAWTRRGPLTLQYGLSARWIAAAAAGLALWLVFPVAALFAVRRSLQRQPHLEAKERLQGYRRWQRGVVLGTGAGLIGSIFLLGFSKITSMLGSAPGFLMIGISLLPVNGLSLVGRLIGLPLEREAWPQRRELKWWNAVSAELITITVILVFGGISTGMAQSASRAGGGGLDSYRPLLFLSLGLPLVVGAGWGLWTWWVWRRRKAGAAPDEPEAPPELTEAIRGMTAGVGAPVNRVLLGKASAPDAAPSLVVSGDLILLSRNLLEELDPEQVAALATAAALAAPRTRLDKALAYSWILTLLPMLFTISLAPSGGGRTSSVMPYMMLTMPLVMIPSTLLARRTQRRHEEADQRAAEALGEPRRFLDALRKLEELQIAAASLDPSAAQHSAVTQRRDRLAKRLGLD